MFSLDGVLFTRDGKAMLSKSEMMEELNEYDNLIRALGAIFYTTKRMGSEIMPCIFQAWKEWAFEKKALKIRHMLADKEREDVLNETAACK